MDKTEELGAIPGSRADASSPQAVSTKGFDPARITDLRNGAEALRSWMNSMVEQRKDAWYPHGVEANARDALEASFRIANSVVGCMEIVADILQAIATEARRAETAQTGSVHEGAAIAQTPSGSKTNDG